MTLTRVDAALSAVVLPYLRDLGDRWARGQTGVGHQHFASSVIHGRLLSLTRKWDAGHGPRAVLAAPAGEQHTLGLLSSDWGCARGWRITYLGADTPIDAVQRIVDAIRPAQVVLASVLAEIYLRHRESLADLAAGAPLALAGQGAQAELTRHVGATILDGDPVTEAARLR